MRRFDPGPRLQSFSVKVRRSAAQAFRMIRLEYLSDNIDVDHDVLKQFITLIVDHAPVEGSDVRAAQ